MLLKVTSYSQNYLSFFFFFWMRLKPGVWYSLSFHIAHTVHPQCNTSSCWKKPKILPFTPAVILTAQNSTNSSSSKNSKTHISSLSSFFQSSGDHNPEWLKGVDDGLNANNSNTLQSSYCAMQRPGNREVMMYLYEMQMFYYLQVKYIAET